MSPRRRQPSAPPPPGCEDAWQELRALREGERRRWFRYVAGDWSAGTHVVHLHHLDPEPEGDEVRRTLRTLIRDEAYWWTLGVGDGHRDGQVVDAVLAEAVPPLVPTIAAAKALGMGVNGLAYNVNSGSLLALYGTRHARYLFEDQLRVQRLTRHVGALTREVEDAAGGEARRAQTALDKAIASFDTAQFRWKTIRTLLPDAVRPVDVGADLTPAPSPDPWPIPTMRPPAKRRIRALMIAEQQGWLTYVQPNTEPGGGFDGTFKLEVAGPGRDVLERNLPVAAVLPYVLGQGDARGQGQLVAYRDGLGY